MIDPVWLNGIKPCGLTMEVVDSQQENLLESIGSIPVIGTDRRWYKGKVSGMIRNKEFKSCEIQFSIPTCVEGVFTVGGLRRFIIPQGLIDVESYDITNHPTYFFRSRIDILVNALMGIFDLAFTDFFMSGNPPTDHDIQNRIDSWFKSSTETREAPNTRMGLDSIKEMVLLNVPQEGLDITNRHFPDSLLGVIDPASTPAGEKVNIAYRMCKGAKLEDGEITKSDSIFCSTIYDHHLPVALCPRRTHLVRSAYENSIPLEEFEHPIVGNPGLKGRHLTTAVMNMGAYTGDDAIVFSETAAVKMRAVRSAIEQFYVLGSLHMFVKEGDVILPGAAIAESVDPITQEKEIFYARGIKAASVIDKIVGINSSYFNIKATRIKLLCSYVANVKCGDKVITRSAIKGVVRVLPDDMMPRLPDGRIVEAVVSPESIVNRRALSFYWEAMCTAYILDKVNEGMDLEEAKKTVLVDHFDPRPRFNELVEAGFGDDIRLTLNGAELPEKTFVGLSYFIRLDKIAAEIVSVHNGEPSLNGMRLPIDSAHFSGQKRDFAKGAAMKARGLKNTFNHLVKNNTHARFAYEELSKVLSGYTEPVEQPNQVVEAVEAPEPAMAASA